MKRTAITAAMLLLLASPAAAGGVGLLVSYWSTSDADAEVGLGGMVEIDLNDTLDVEFRFAQLDGLSWPENAPVVDLEAFPVDIGLAYNFRGRGRATPYVGGGVSYVLFDTNVGEIDDEIGYYAVAGVDVAAANLFAVVFEVYYRDVDANLKGGGIAQFVDVPIDFSGPGANLGLMFRW